MVSASAHQGFEEKACGRGVASSAGELMQMVCRMQTPRLKPYRWESPSVVQAARRLVEIVIRLRSHNSGWPEALPQTPENLAPYITEEVGELLVALQQMVHQSSPAGPAGAEELVLISQLQPRLLAAIAASCYEAMRLLEGVKARVWQQDKYVLRIVRLVPVLSFGNEQLQLPLDLVTGSAPCGQDWLPGTVQVQLVEGDLDSQRRSLTDWISLIGEQLGRTIPDLAKLMTTGWPAVGLLPQSAWQSGLLKLELQLADMGQRVPASPVLVETQDPLEPSAESLILSPPVAAIVEQRLEQEPLNAWVSCTDEDWIQAFLLENGCCDLAADWLFSPVVEEMSIVKAAFEAVNRLQGPQSWLKHTFVNQALLVADLWPRLRWYVIRHCEPVMELMAGQPVRYIHPGEPWRSGHLRLQVLMMISLPETGWVVDLATGHVGLVAPPMASPETLIDGFTLTGSGNGSGLQSVASLGALTADLLSAAGLPGRLWDGVSIELQQLEGSVAVVPGQLRLSWQFTIWPATP